MSATIMSHFFFFFFIFLMFAQAHAVNNNIFVFWLKYFQAMQFFFSVRHQRNKTVQVIETFDTVHGLMQTSFFSFQFCCYFYSDFFLDFFFFLFVFFCSTLSSFSSLQRPLRRRVFSYGARGRPLPTRMSMCRTSTLGNKQMHSHTLKG